MERELNEPVLADDYPVYAGYLYVADGKVIESDWHDITVARLKRLLPATEIRRCDIYGRKAQMDARATPSDASQADSNSRSGE